MKVSSELFKGRVFLVFSFLFYLALIVSLFPDPVWMGTSFGKRDILRYYFPIWHTSVQMVKEGVLPLWNPYSNFGTPFLANVQTCVFYPLTILFYLPDYLWGFNFYILLHIALAAFFTLIWMRECGASKEASFLSGAACGLSGYVLSTINLTISLCSLIYLPLVLVCLRRSLRERGFFWPASGGVVLAFQYLAGDPAVVFGTLVACTLFIFCRTVERSWASKKIHMGAAVHFTAMVLVFLGLTAFQTLLFAEFLKFSDRAAPVYDQITMWSMQYNDLLGFVVPYFTDISTHFMDYWVRQSWLENSYIGITVFMLACYSMRGLKKNLPRYHLFLALFALSLAFGRFSFVHRLFFEFFPFFKFIRYPARFLFMFSFAMACLAGFGLDALLRRLDRPEKSLLSRRKALVLGGILLFLTAGILLSGYYAEEIRQLVYRTVHAYFEKSPKENWTGTQTVEMIYPFLYNLRRTFILLSFCLIGYFCVMNFKPNKRIMVGFLGLLVFADLVETNVIEFRVDREYMERVGRNMQFIRQDKGIFRAHASPSAAAYQGKIHEDVQTLSDSLDYLLEVFSPNMHLFHKISYTQSYDSLSSRDLFNILEKEMTIRHPARYRFLDMLNIKYVVSLRDHLGDSYRLLQHAKPGYLYQNENVLPRTFLVPSHVVVKDHTAVLDRVLSEDFDPRAAVYLEEDPGVSLAGPGPETAGENEVEILSYAPNGIRMRVRSLRDQWLFLSDTFYPGWKAAVNGENKKIFKANYSFRAVRVPAGDSIVQWKYEPILFRIGSGISLLTALGLAAALIRRRRSKAS